MEEITPENYSNNSSIKRENAQFSEAYNIDKNTDELEGLVKATNAALAVLSEQLTTIAGKLDTLGGKIDSSNGLLNDIKTNTTP